MPRVDSVLPGGMDIRRIQSEEDKEPMSDYRDTRNEKPVNPDESLPFSAGGFLKRRFVDVCPHRRN